VKESIHYKIKRKEKGMIIKIDMENDFDQVGHPFLFQILSNFGFSKDFINWIKACIRSPWIAPLVNGCLGLFFPLTKGLRQGCPLSPLLYIIMADCLTKKLEEERVNGNIPLISIARGAKEINHSQFAGDMRLMDGTSVIIASRFKSILEKKL
jgi:hypothetical protein